MFLGKKRDRRKEESDVKSLTGHLEKAEYRLIRIAGKKRKNERGGSGPETRWQMGNEQTLLETV